MCPSRLARSWRPLNRLAANREDATCKVVYYDPSQGQEQDRQGRNAAGSCETHTDVQLSRVQGSVAKLLDQSETLMYLELDTKVVYRRYASLFFVCGIGASDNELVTLEIIHRYVEVLDRYFGNVSFWFRLSYIL